LRRTASPNPQAGQGLRLRPAPGYRDYTLSPGFHDPVLADRGPHGLDPGTGGRMMTLLGLLIVGVALVMLAVELARTG
jgi:hypothetical protein